MAIERAEWTGLVSRKSPHRTVELVTPLEQSAIGGSGAFKGLCNDGQAWWIKPTNQLQQGKTIVTEQVLARAGRLIGAPICEVTLVEITSDTSGWEFRPGHRIEPSLAHGSLHIGDPNTQDGTLRSRDRDNNSVRHVGAFALWDWCYGGDQQWLYAAHNEDQTFAHDLGHFLPGANTWSEDLLERSVDEDWMPRWPADQLSRTECERLADALMGIRRAQLLEILDGIPVAWPVTDIELEALGWFLERRAPAVAARLRMLASAL